MSQRVRLVGMVVQLELVADDGGDLRRLQVQPLVFDAVEAKTFDLDAVVERAQAEYLQRQSPVPVPANGHQELVGEESAWMGGQPD